MELEDQLLRSFFVYFLPISSMILFMERAFEKTSVHLITKCFSMLLSGFDQISRPGMDAVEDVVDLQVFVKCNSFTTVSIKLFWKIWYFNNFSIAKEQIFRRRIVHSQCKAASKNPVEMNAWIQEPNYPSRSQHISLDAVIKVGYLLYLTVSVIGSA